MIETKSIKLSANENYYGCSPKVITAIENHYRTIYEYPEMNPIKLKEKIANKHSVNIDNVIVGPGSVAIINNIIQTFSNNVDEILTFEKSFVAYGQLTQTHGRKCVFAPLKDFRCIPENIIPLVNSKTRVIFIANPNNPTGTAITHAEMEYLMKNIPKEIIVVHDEAYSEYIQQTDFPKSIELLKKYPNLIILHSFSKIYGLAGLRAGYALADTKIIQQLSKFHVPYSLNYLTSCAAIAALEDEEFTNTSKLRNQEEAIFLFENLIKLGYNTIRSYANFVYLWFDSELNKKKVYDKLFQAGIIVCDLQVFGQEKSLRIGIGDRKINTYILELISQL